MGCAMTSWRPWLLNESAAAESQLPTAKNQLQDLQQQIVPTETADSIDASGASKNASGRRTRGDAMNRASRERTEGKTATGSRGTRVLNSPTS